MSISLLRVTAEDIFTLAMQAPDLVTEQRKTQAGAVSREQTG